MRTVSPGRKRKAAKTIVIVIPKHTTFFFMYIVSICSDSFEINRIV